VHEQ
jgi:Ciliary BBSome complex subunit 2, C-terminal